MVLTFADAPTKGKAAFNAYGALISYGIGGGLSDEFQLSATLVDFLNTGNLSLNPVDPARAAKVKGPDFASRQANVLQYLDQYISQLHQLNAKPLAKTHWRNHTGSIEPTDTLLLELITDLTRGFTEVRTAVHNHSPEVGVTWS
jgi:hypothetical protein